MTVAWSGEHRLFEIGELVPVSIRSRESDRTIAGHVAIGKKALVLNGP